MIDRKSLDKLCKKRSKTPNILAPKAKPAVTGSKTLAIAQAEIRGIAQSIIEQVAEHRHLAAGPAMVMVLIERCEATKRKLMAGERVRIGYAAKADGKVRLLGGIPDTVGGSEPARADFVVTLSGDWLDTIAEDPERQLKTVALIDHELLHCGAKIAGKFIPPGEVEAEVERLGADHIETRDDFHHEFGDVLIRYYHRDDDDALTWKLRKHDVEEFHGVVDRYGAWDRCLATLVDVLVEDEPTPLLDLPAGRQVGTRRGDSAAAG